MSKKKETIDELLAEALLMEAEQPYEVPTNWVWSYAWAITKTLRGVSYKNHQVEGQKNDNNLLVLRGGNIQDGSILNQDDNVYVSDEIVKEEQRLQKNDVVIVSSTGSSKVIGKAASVINEFVGESFGAFLTAIRPSLKMDGSYFGFYYQTANYRSMISSLAKGSNINNIKKEHLDYLTFPLPPINEQKRIADKVERLLSKIEEAKQLIEEAKDTFEHRRAAVVNTLLEDSSIKQMVNIGDIADVKGGKRLPKGETLVNENTGFPYIKAGDLKNGTVLLDKLQFLLPSTQEKIKNYIVSAGDVYITIVGACIGDVGVIPKEVDGANLTENAAKLTNLKGCLPEYLSLWLSSNKAQNLIKESIASATLGKLSLTRIKSLPISLVDIESQVEIVDKYQKFIKKENEIVQNLDKIDLDMLKQSILSKAYKGELGTNDPNDESAIDLLKEMLQEQVK